MNSLASEEGNDATILAAAPFCTFESPSRSSRCLVRFRTEPKPGESSCRVFAGSRRVQGRRAAKSAHLSLNVVPPCLKPELPFAHQGSCKHAFQGVCRLTCHKAGKAANGSLVIAALILVAYPSQHRGRTPSVSCPHQSVV